MERLVLWHRLVPAARDEQDDPDRHAAWTSAVAARMRRARGRLLSVVGNSVAAEFDTLDLRDALDLALSLLEESERLEPPMKACFGAAAGELSNAPQERGGFRIGSALDRAALLANRARPGELVLDPTAREQAAKEFLFGRQVAAGAGTMRGQTVDRENPRRATCRPAIRHLLPPTLPPSASEALERLRTLSRAQGPHRLILRGPIGAGSREWIDSLERELEPPLVLRLDAVPGSLEPLGSLRLGLLRMWHSPEGVDAAVRAGGADNESAAALAGVARGHAVDQPDIIRAVRALLEVHGGDTVAPFIVLDPLSVVDPATAEVVAEATSSEGPQALLLARLPLDARIPSPLLREGPPEELTLPILRMPDARAVAESILGPNTDENVARRVAVLGGTSPLGVCEAARAMIASGDLVWEEERFRWRVGPRSGVTAIPVESHLQERLGSLEPTPMRILEAVCAAPTGAQRELLAHVTASDGLSDVELDTGIEQLRSEALLAVHDPWLATSSVLRAVVVQSMPPSRTGELYRFIAEGMAVVSDRDADFAKATQGYFLAEGGQEADGARLMIEAGRAATLAGFTRPAVRLAAAAVQVDSSPETKAAATRLSRASMAKEVPARAKSQPPGAPNLDTTAYGKPEDEIVLDVEDIEISVAHETVQAILASDFELVDRSIDMAIAEGHDRAAADRMRAIASLAKGDMTGAQRGIARMRTATSEEPGSIARGALARALVLLASGNAHQAVRFAMRALALTRREHSELGEKASMRTLELCFRVLSHRGAAPAIELVSHAS